ncbi:bifunctional indole-3-glycerol phosphate synthase/phosphoribosylanthranilate isomerase, partial [Corynebacterium sanguinis]|nr:bifunctional indole-3-glycerol phosphate synthase/phosphoribosylanthranilate isomerase [Corynebacterium sanguinis]
GMIREHYEPGEIASTYSRYAAGISVLCEPDKFGGDYDHLATVASITHLPVLCKDFIVDEIQIYAARYFGADAVLLMLSVLDDAQYRHLSDLAARLGLDVLTEVIDEEEAERAGRLGAKIFGINHRNLHDLSI